MKISLSPIQYFDLAGVPLASGRLKVYLHGSDTLATTYTMDGNDFVEAENPLTLDNAGEMPETLFMEVAIYDISVEKYVDGVYEKISDFQFGFVMPDVKNDTIIHGIDGLANANPSLGSVTVVGYNTETDCGARTYIWDANCTDPADGGAIIESDTTQNGRWILLSDLREMPCTYYGITPGDEANISAFLTYQPIIGTYGVYMPPIPRFLKGTYTSTGFFTVTKTLSFDPGATFVSATFNCANVEIATPVSNYVADFSFTRQSYAESGWFRSVESFWYCGAKHLHQSSANHFANTDHTTMISIANAHISGNPVTMVGNGTLRFVNCRIEDRSLSTNWRVYFESMFITDRWFADGNWDIGDYRYHRQHASLTDNVVYLSNFSDANVYTLWMAAYGQTSLDLQGRAISTITASMPFTSISNGVVNEAHFTHDITMYNVTINNLYMESKVAKLIGYRCNIALKDSRVGLLSLTESQFTNYVDVNTFDTQINMSDTHIDLTNGSFTREAGDRWQGTGVVLADCYVTGGIVHDTVADISGTRFTNTRVVIVPGGSEGGGYLVLRFVGNTLNGASQLAITTSLDGQSDAGCYECEVSLFEVRDNTFNTSMAGVTMPYWAEDMEHRFIQGVTTFNPSTGDATNIASTSYRSTYIYSNNYGNCPKQVGDVCPESTLSATSVAIISPWGTGSMAQLNVTSVAPFDSVFALPAIYNGSKAVVPDPTGTTIPISTGLAVVVPYKYKALSTTNQNGGNCVDFPLSAYVCLCALDKSLPNDMFSVRLCGYNETAQFFGINPIGTCAC